jgi:hypothetical protein
LGISADEIAIFGFLLEAYQRALGLVASSASKNLDSFQLVMSARLTLREVIART